MKALALLLGLIFSLPALTFAQGEYDDLYYTPSDRQEARKNYELKTADQIVSQQKNYSSTAVNDYQVITPSVNNDRIYNTTQGRTVNPEYVAQYRSRADARAQDAAVNDDIYFEEDYAQTGQFHDEGAHNQPVVNNYYYGSSWADPFYDPFYVNNWRWRYNDIRWRRAAMYYDPFYDPFYAYTPGWSGVSINIGFGWGTSWGNAWYGNRFSRWHYDPWYTPYYGGYYGGGFYNNYWGPAHSQIYYTTVNNYNESHNHSVRRGPGTSRGSVISDRGRTSVAENGPVTRVPVKRSSFTGDRNGRVGSSAVTSGRVIDRSGVETRSPRDYSDVKERYTRPTERSGIDRGTTFPTRSRSMDRTPSRTYDRSTAPIRNNRNNRSVTPSRSGENNRSVTPSRSGNNNRSVTPSRSGNNNRSVTPSRSGNNNRSVTPSRSGNNNRSVTPSRSSGNNNRSVTPSRSGNNNRSSYSPGRSSGSSGGSSYTPSRSSSSSSGTSGSSRSSSRRGGN